MPRGEAAEESLACGAGWQPGFLAIIAAGSGGGTWWSLGAGVREHEPHPDCMVKVGWKALQTAGCRHPHSPVTARRSSQAFLGRMVHLYRNTQEGNTHFAVITLLSQVSLTHSLSYQELKHWVLHIPNPGGWGAGLQRPWCS